MSFLSKQLVRNFAVATNLINKHKIAVRKLTINDEKQVCDLLVDYYPYSFQKFGIDDECSKAYIKARARILLKANQSLGAFDISSNKLVGNVLIYNGTNFAQEVKLYEEEGFIFTPKFDTLRRYWLSNEERALKLLKVNKAQFWGLGVVHEAYRNSGVYTAMLHKSMTSLQYSGCKYVITIANLDFVINVLMKYYAFKRLQNVRTVDYIDPKINTKPFANIPEIVSTLFSTKPIYSKV